MGRAEGNIKFPCGYEYHVVVSQWFGHISLDDMPICPLHGKKCVVSEVSE